MSSTRYPVPRGRPTPEGLRVLLAGGGVAALETVLALQSLAADRVSISILTGSTEFVYRPLEVLEPFQPAAVVRLPWDELAADLGIRHVAGRLASVDPDRRVVKTADGHSVHFDLLVLAVGATPRPAVRGALTLGAPGTRASISALIAQLESGSARRVAFASPPGLSWTIAIYELALQTARVAAEARAGGDLSLFTAEMQPLQVLGEDGSALIRGLLEEHGIGLYTGCVPDSFEDGRLWLELGGSVQADEVVALPRLEGPAIGGIRCAAQGFLKVDRHGLVDGEDSVYAAGDVTDFPIKQGGLASQQADAVAAHIATRAGAAVELAPFDPVLRATLLTVEGPRYMRLELSGSGHAEIDEAPLWWPPAKIVGRHLAPFLANRLGQRDLRPAVR